VTAPMKCDMAIIGGGPAGLAAAIEARRSGLNVMLFDERVDLGGQIFKQIRKERRDPLLAQVPHLAGAGGRQAKEGRELIESVKASGTRIFCESLVWDLEGTSLRCIVDGSNVEVNAAYVLLAPGAYDRPTPIPGWTLPGVFTAGGLQTFAKTQGVIPGRHLVLAGNGPLLLAFAAELATWGAGIEAVVEVAAPPRGVRLARVARSAAADLPLLVDGLNYFVKLRRRGVRYQYRTVVTSIVGDEHVEGVVISRVDKSGAIILDSTELLEADAVCLGYGLMPSCELAAVAGCTLRRDPDSGADVPVLNEYQETDVSGILAAGDGVGVLGAPAAMEQGRIAAIRVAAMLDRLDADEAARRHASSARQLRAHRRFQDAVREVYRHRVNLARLATDETIVCRCEDVSVAQLRGDATSAGDSDTNTFRAHLRVAMGPCQGRNCLPTLAGLAGQPGFEFANLNAPMTPRSPARPVRIGDLVASRPADVGEFDLPIDASTVEEICSSERDR